MAGLTEAINAIIDPVSAGLILMTIGLMIVQHTFEVAVPRHYPAICVGIMIILCDFIRVNNIGVSGVNKEYQLGYENAGANSGIMLSILLTSVVCDLIDNYYSRAAIYSFILMIFSLLGVVHGNNKFSFKNEPLEYSQLTIAVMDVGTWQNEGWRFVIAYAILTVFCLCHHVAQLKKLIPPAILDNGIDKRRHPSWRTAPLGDDGRPIEGEDDTEKMGYV